MSQRTWKFFFLRNPIILTVEGTGIVAILLIFYWNGISFEDKDILADGLGIGVCFWYGGISGLLCTEETDIIV